MRRGGYRVDIIKANHSVFVGVYKARTEAEKAHADAESYRFAVQK